MSEMTKLIVRMQEGDDVVNGSCTRLKTKLGAKIIKLTEVAQVGKLKPGDTLILLAHGDTSKLGGKTPAQIADILAKADLPSGVIIDLVACESGKGGSPLALELKTQLVNSKKIVPKSVSGGTAYMAVLDQGKVISATADFDARGNATNVQQVNKGKVKEQTKFGERTRNVDPNYRTGG
jgi:hypothetical protein